VILEARDLEHGYGAGEGRVEVLRGIDLQIDRGELVIILGPSGSGKSTLLTLIGGLRTPDRGTVHIAGREVPSDAESAAALRRRSVRFVFQRPHLIPALTALENVALGARLAGLGPRAKEAARAALERLGLGDRIDHRPHELSVGQAQRVSLARTLAAPAALVVADEPTAALDSDSAMEAVRAIAELRDASACVLVTHDVRLTRFATRVVTLEGGRLIEGAAS
jgi:ABC-type lipoprotein export system ATPase subunit